MSSSRLIVVGCGWNVWQDLEGVSLDDDFMAVNDIGCYLPKVDHWYSAQPDALRVWAEFRKVKYDDAPKLWSPETHDFDHVGSSGYLATLVGLALGYGDIRVCGCPLDDLGHFFEPLGVPTPDFRKHRSVWSTLPRSVSMISPNPRGQAHS